MKVILLLVALYALWWLLRRSFGPRPTAPPASEPPALQTMIACQQCGMHLPRNEALPGRGGYFCGKPHRMAFEREHGAP